MRTPNKRDCDASTFLRRKERRAREVLWAWARAALHEPDLRAAAAGRLVPAHRLKDQELANVAWALAVAEDPHIVRKGTPASHSTQFPHGVFLGERKNGRCCANEKAHALSLLW